MSSTREHLRGRFDPDCVDAVLQRLGEPGRVELTAGFLRDLVDCDEGEAARLLDLLFAEGELAKQLTYACPACDARIVTTGEVNQVCPECSATLADHGAIRVEAVYLRENERGQVVRWMLVLHGMNTRGAWQEQFAWIAATTYIRAVPVFIYKYGIFRLGVTLRWRQRQQVRRLVRRVNALADASEQRLGRRPDVLAHSFGTWLLAHALLDDSQLQVGRVILLGSIVRPDFDWQLLFDRGQVESVLNHYSPDDRTVPWAQLGIWDSGPSGARGANAGTGVINHATPGLRHSEYFSAEHLSRLYNEVWRPFLTQGKGVVTAPANTRADTWQGLPRFVQGVTRRLIVAVALLFASLAVIAMTLGSFRLASYLF